jgi:beta-lactamase class A
MLILSDNEAANELEVWLAGSTSAGSARVNETMRALGLTDSQMYGGYATRGAASAAAPIPIRIESQPAFGLGKYTTAWDLARLARAVYLAAAGKGPLLHLGVSGSEARYLLWLLAQVVDRGKLDRYFGSGPVVMHKAGWLTGVRHDNGAISAIVGVMLHEPETGIVHPDKAEAGVLHRLLGIQVQRVLQEEGKCNHRGCAGRL